MTRAALLLIDFQRDFLERPGLSPSADTLVADSAAFLQAWRASGAAVIHVHTQVRADGGDRMPHWARSNYWACVENTPGALSPPALAPASSEISIQKSFFSGFSNPQLDHVLAAQDIDTLVLAGIFLHGCIRSTAFDAYERGYEVLIARDLVGSYDPMQSEATRSYSEGRAAAFLHSEEILGRLFPSKVQSVRLQPTMPSACVGNIWRSDPSAHLAVHRNPSDTEQVYSVIPMAGRDLISLATESAWSSKAAGSALGAKTRLDLLHRWRIALGNQAQRLELLLAAEIGKPVRDAREEISRAIGHLEAVGKYLKEESNLDARTKVRYRPIGCVGLITPWNNPVAIPVSKISAALAFGNTVIWKPAPEAATISAVLMDALIAAGAPAGAVNLVFGDAETARGLITDPHVNAISLTGSVAAGRSAAALCALHNKPLQGELGGNNAMIVLGDVDLSRIAPALARSAFGFAGQRCTAIRRFIVERSIRAEFQTSMMNAIQGLKIGDPRREETDMGPLISPRSIARLEFVINSAERSGARVLCGGKRLNLSGPGCWFEPTLVSEAAPDSPVVQEETFGPLAVVLQADDLDHAIALANNVPHGLVSGLLTADLKAQAEFASQAHAGILKYLPGPMPIHPDAPFGGWKASRIGPPEHGAWDREFFTRPQAIYF